MAQTLEALTKTLNQASAHVDAFCRALDRSKQHEAWSGDWLDLSRRASDRFAEFVRAHDELVELAKAGAAQAIPKSVADDPARWLLGTLQYIDDARALMLPGIPGEVDDGRLGELRDAIRSRWRALVYAGIVGAKAGAGGVAAQAVGTVSNPPRVEVDERRLCVIIAGTSYDLTDDGAKMLATLVKANGEWVGGNLLPTRPDKLKAKMPAPVQALIKTHKRNGYCIPSLRT